MGDSVRAANTVTAPREVYSLDASTSSANAELPKSFCDSFITIDAEGGDVWVRFESKKDVASPTVVTTGSSTGTPVAAVSNLGWRVPAGEERHFDLSTIPTEDVDDGTIMMAYRSAAGTPRFNFYKSSGPAET